MRKQLALFFSIIVSGLIAAPSFAATAIEYGHYPRGTQESPREKQLQRGFEPKMQRQFTPPAVMQRSRGTEGPRGPVLTPPRGGFGGTMSPGRQ